MTLNQRDISRERRVRIIDYLNKGLTVEQVALRLGVSRYTVNYYRKNPEKAEDKPIKHGGGHRRALTLHQALVAYSRYQQGEYATHLASEYGCSHQTLSKYFKLIREGKLS